MKKLIFSLEKSIFPQKINFFSTKIDFPWKIDFFIRRLISNRKKRFFLTKIDFVHGKNRYFVTKIDFSLNNSVSHEKIDFFNEQIILQNKKLFFLEKIDLLIKPSILYSRLLNLRQFIFGVAFVEKCPTIQIQNSACLNLARGVFVKYAQIQNTIPRF